MRELLAGLGHPERCYPAIHVVGTNGKSTATRTIAALIQGERRRAGAYTSPHVSGWAERIWVEGAESDFERAVARVRPVAEELEATQFETLTAAALLEFAEREVDVAVLEAGLGGRLDATNVVGAEVVLLTNVSLDHTEVLGDTRDQIAEEKLAVAHGARVVVLPDNEYTDLATRVSQSGAEIVTGEAREAAERFLGRSISNPELPVDLPGRLEWRGRELWDGAHNDGGTAWLRRRIDRSVHVVVASILTDHYTPAMLQDLSAVAPRLIATQSSNARALPAAELAHLAAPLFGTVEVEPDPRHALARARATTAGVVLVTGSLYLLAELTAAEEHEVR